MAEQQISHLWGQLWITILYQSVWESQYGYWLVLVLHVANAPTLGTDSGYEFPTRCPTWDIELFQHVIKIVKIYQDAIFVHHHV